MRCESVASGLAAGVEVLHRVQVGLHRGRYRLALGGGLQAAFTLAVRDVPDSAAPEIKAVTEPYRAGADMLVGRARAAYLEFGYTEEAFGELLAETEAEVDAVLSSTDPSLSPPYSFEDCAALIGQ